MGNRRIKVSFISVKIKRSLRKLQNQIFTSKTHELKNLRIGLLILGVLNA